MITLQVRRVTYEDIEVDPGDVVSMREAADILDMTTQGVGSALNRERLTELVDPDASMAKNRRYLLRREVEELAARKRRAAEKRRAIEGA
jgi:hypothetical protein